MRTTLNIDEELVQAAMAVTGEKNRSKAVSKAIEECVRRKRLEELRAMLGKTDLNLDDWYEFRHAERT